jgi:beta-glucanase (GH16 family)
MNNKSLSLTIALILAASSANAELIVQLGNAVGDSAQQASSTSVSGIDETSSFTTGTFSLTGTGPISFTLNTSATNGSLSGQDVGWGVSGGSDNAGIDNNGDGSTLEALTFTLSNISGLDAGQSLVFKEFGVRWGKSGADEYYTVNGGSESVFPNSTQAVSLADLTTLTVGAGSSGNTGFALDYVTVDVVTGDVVPDPPTGQQVPPAGYTLEWSDEFSGTEMDPEKWAHRSLGPRRDGVNTADAVSMTGVGQIALTTSQVGSEYHTGMIGTQNKFEATFGYWEARIRLQDEVGHWSAFWLQSPTIGNPIGDPATAGAEIDVVEYHSQWGDTAQFAYHWDGYGSDHKSRNQSSSSAGLAEGFHTFGVLWTADEYIFYIDGIEKWRSSDAVSHRPQYAILSLEVGTWAGVIQNATLPDGIEVDYVRWYSPPIEPSKLEMTKPVDDTVEITVQTELGASYWLERSTDLQEWARVNESPQVLGDGNPATFTGDASSDRAFFRVNATYRSK